MSENKTGKYLKYAIGEIVLVVIGILIALQINNWNESRKQEKAMQVALTSLISDLKLDIIDLKEDIDILTSKQVQFGEFRERLSRPEATIDSVKQIFRYEFSQFFDPSHELNRNTITSLLSTGKIDLFPQELKEKILEHNSSQLKEIKVMDINVGIWLQSERSVGINMQSEHSQLDDYVVRGPLLEQYWSQREDKLVLEEFLNTLTKVTIMSDLIRWRKEILLENTKELLKILGDYKKS